MIKGYLLLRVALLAVATAGYGVSSGGNAVRVEGTLTCAGGVAIHAQATSKRFLTTSHHDLPVSVFADGIPVKHIITDESGHIEGCGAAPVGMFTVENPPFFSLIIKHYCGGERVYTMPIKFTHYASNCNDAKENFFNVGVLDLTRDPGHPLRRH